MLMIRYFSDDFSLITLYKRNHSYQPPCKVDIKLSLSLCSNLVSSFSDNSQSASLISTNIPGRLHKPKSTSPPSPQTSRP